MSTDATELPDLKRRELLVKATATVGGLAICGAAVPFLDSLRPSARATANAAPVDFDVSKLTPGALTTVQWRGRPIWVLKRTDEQLRTLAKVTRELSDPQSKVPQQPADMNLHLADGVRAVDPHLLVLCGICTHLGCIPAITPARGRSVRSGLAASTVRATARNTICPAACSQGHPRRSICRCRPTTWRTRMCCGLARRRTEVTRTGNRRSGS